MKTKGRAVLRHDDEDYRHNESVAWSALGFSGSWTSGRSDEQEEIYEEIKASVQTFQESSHSNPAIVGYREVED
jgi:hypothetical protein